MPTRSSKSDPQGIAGLPIDIYGGQTIDPTANVIALVKSQAEAAKALRDADTKFNDSVAAHLKEIGDLRAEYSETLRLSDLDRLAKTRDVDVLAGAASAAALATAVQTLAKQTTDQAQVLSAQADSMFKAVNAQIAELQKAQYSQTGRSSVTDPAMLDVISRVDKIATSLSGTGGQAQGQKNVWAMVVVLVGLLFTAAGFLVGLAGLVITLIVVYGGK